MGPIAAQLLSTYGMIPHGYCLNWNPTLLLLQAGSDTLTALSYYLIPIALLYFLHKRPHTGYSWVVLLFALFIMACGTTHLMDVVVLWVPDYWTQGVVKAITAAVSVATAVLLWPLVPRVLALPTPTQLQEANTQLRGEIAVRARVEGELRSLQADLEHRVQERTTELEEAKEALQREVTERTRVDRMKDELLAVVSHELRTPLTSISGALHLLYAEPSDDPDERQELMEIALRNSERMMRLLHILLDLDSIESGRVVFAQKPLSLVELTRTALREHQVLAQQHGAHLVLACGNEAGPVLGDPDRLMQVLTNLLSNAIKYAPSGTTVEVSVEAAPGHTRVSVRDRGPGVPVADRQRVFDKFVQGSANGRPPADGLGLGLSIVRAIVDRHGGHAGLDSAPGAGSTFYFELPLAPGMLAADASAPGLDTGDTAPC